MKNRGMFFCFFVFEILFLCSLRILSRKWNVGEMAVYESFLCVWIGASSFGKNLKYGLYS